MQIYKYFSILTSQPKNDYKLFRTIFMVMATIKYNAVKWLNDADLKIETFKK